MLKADYEKFISREAEILVVGVPHRVYRDAKLGDRELIDIWGALGGIRL